MHNAFRHDGPPRSSRLRVPLRTGDDPVDPTALLLVSVSHGKSFPRVISLVDRSLDGLARIGLHVRTASTRAGGILRIVGELVLSSMAVLTGRARIRRADFVEALRQSGHAALVIIAVVNLLVGGILAFVGAIQLNRLGAGIYVANLVGIAVVREMAAVMTAIVMAGRTGAAFAAQLATMHGNEEVDALVVLGITPTEHLVLPRVAALTIMMPLLYVYGCAVGLLGGLAIATLTLDVGPAAFIAQIRGNIGIDQFLIGATKSLCFGALIAFIACRVGLAAERSAAGVGRATTSAAVHGIVGVIAVDAAFAVALHVLDL
jgi:phospholipid/cholesterol/gamma-HCH transport system permease protein